MPRRDGLALTAYQPLCKGEVRDDPVLTRIGERHGVDRVGGRARLPDGGGARRHPGLVEREPICAPTSRRTDVRLDDAEMAAIRALDRGYRRIDPAKSPRWDD